MTKLYFPFGGSPKNLRATKLLEKWEEEGKEGIFVVTGYPNMDKGEVEDMVSSLLSQGVNGENIFIDGSYETVSNVESLEKFLLARKIKLDQCKVFASTGPLHWFRFKLIFLWKLIFNKKHPNFFGINFLLSGEREVWYAVIAIVPYIVCTPKGFQLITRVLRRKEYLLCKKGKAIKEIAQKYGVEYID